MRGPLSRVPGHENASARRRRAWRVRWALATSLAAHLVLALVMFSSKDRPPAPLAPLPEVVEIDFEIPQVAVAVPASAGAPTGMPSHAAPGMLASRGKNAASHRVALSVAPEDVEGSAKGAAVQVPSASSNLGAPSDAGGSPNGEAARWATFQPEHPNLNGAMRFSTPTEKPHDLLVPPTTKKGIPAREEVPNVMQGSGDVTARVAEDGSIRFRDPRAIKANKLPIYAYGDGMENGSNRANDPGAIEKRRGPWDAFSQGVRVGLSGKFDITDQVMKLAGQDPYASTKRTMANETREQRLCMAKRYQGERLKQELLALSTKVRHLAARADLSAAQRRELVFAIWDECSEDSDTTTDYGAMARATILAIVREAFPAGSEGAYQPTELLALNERRSSRQRFAPYDPSPLTRARHPDGGAPTECP
jgi:hypothetical protein